LMLDILHNEGIHDITLITERAIRSHRSRRRVAGKTGP
jgi:hypothetical protein